ncbi:MAG: radical SAM protein [Deltaproteobacteria bacterium]|nr:radical SAM protein [Deltaproteobacteria bacterium]
MTKKRSNHRNASRAPAAYLTALVANVDGEIIDLEGYAAVGMDGPILAPLTTRTTRRMPHGSEFMFLPDRRPVVYDLETEDLVTVLENPFAPGEPVFPLAAFNSPGYIITQLCAYEETETAGFLPLFSYGAVGWHAGRFYTAVQQVDKERRQDLRLMPMDKVQGGVRLFQKEMPTNRLRRHLEKCALEYGCPAAKNFFIGRCEAPLPTSPECNARCLGCLSLQKDSLIPCSQDRIDFMPIPEEIAEVALAHFERVPDGVVSFGQGCEGDPLLAAASIEPAIRLIRRQTERGTINLNTNASLPDTVAALFDAGLDSMRVSINSLREACYQAYFRPRGYTFADIMHSIDMTLARGGHVALNYLNLPGFTDTPEEYEALAAFLTERPIHLIQWRNLNYDPLGYYDVMDEVAVHSRPMGVKTLLKKIRRRFPGVKFGYFNPALR